MAIEITDEIFEKEVVESQVPVLAEFYVASCFRCSVTMAALDELEETHPEKVKIAKINFANNKNIFSKLGIKGTPTIAVFKDGKEMERFHGDATVEDIKNFVETLVSA